MILILPLKSTQLIIFP